MSEAASTSMLSDPKFQERLARMREANARTAAEREKLRGRLRMSDDHRSKNLFLLRAFFFATQSDFGRMVGLQQPNVSRLEGGTDQLTDYEAREIEKKLGLPSDWLDRDNGVSLFLSNEELLLLRETERFSPDTLKGLTAALAGLARSTSTDPHD